MKRRHDERVPSRRYAAQCVCLDHARLRCCLYHAPCVPLQNRHVTWLFGGLVQCVCLNLYHRILPSLPHHVRLRRCEWRYWLGTNATRRSRTSMRDIWLEKSIATQLGIARAWLTRSDGSTDQEWAKLQIIDDNGSSLRIFVRVSGQRPDNFLRILKARVKPAPTASHTDKVPDSFVRLLSPTVPRRSRPLSHPSVTTPSALDHRTHYSLCGSIPYDTPHMARHDSVSTSR